jgi:dCMP deaminase
MVFMDPNIFLHSDSAISMDKYYMNIAIAVRRKANCMGRKVGAILVRENRIISTGYNGTPEGVENCVDGGCVRCKNPKKYKRSAGYDVCICVHAEENALITAARFGISVADAIAYSTMRPCFVCTKLLFQAKVRGIYYLHEWTHKNKELRDQYELLQARFPERVRRLKMGDPDDDWANNHSKGEANGMGAILIPTLPKNRNQSGNGRLATRSRVVRRH